MSVIQRRTTTTFGKLTALRSDHVPGRPKLDLFQLVTFLALGACFLWSYWTTLATMADRWTHEAQYSHGYIIPVFAGFLLWQRRKQCPTAFQMNELGLIVCGAATALRLGGTFFNLGGIDALSLVLCLFGVCLLLGGWRAVRWAWPGIAFLLFMLPLPFRVEGWLAHPLQRVATSASTFMLVILGYPATSQGNIITIHAHQIGVVEACGGLSMLMSFLALATFVVLIIKRPVADKIAIVISAIPIALLANVIRITVTGILYENVGDEAARAFFHDYAGYFMIVLTLFMLWVELWVFSRLFIDAEERPMSVFQRSAAPAKN